MTATAARPAARPGTGRSRGPHWSIRACEGAVDVAVVLLASWTVVYHVCLLADVDVDGAIGLEAGLLLAGASLWVWAGRRSPDAAMDGDLLVEPVPPVSAPVPERPGLGRGLVLGGGVAILGSAVLFAVDGPWPAVVALWLLAAVAGAGRATIRLHQGTDHGSSRPRLAPRDSTRGQDGTVVALVWAVALGALSLFTLRGNPDDLYYVNLSQWVVDHGTFPLHDTIFSDQAFPMASWPPVASYDALVGTVARLLHAHAASLVYVVVPPVATFLTVLALWRLLRAWRVRPVAVALSVSLVFLLLDSAAGYATPGNLFLTRLWQGKVILLCLVVPSLLVYALRHVERPTRGSAGWLFLGGVAAVGLSTSAMFLVPVVAVAGAAPLLLRRPSRAVAGFAAMAAYPLATGVLTVAVHGHSADDFESRRLYRFEPWWFGHQIFLDGAMALIAVTAVLAGAFLVPHRSARLTTALLTLATGITFVPGVTRLSYDLVGLGPTLWRVSWVASIPALVGVLGASLARHGPHRAPRAVLLVALLGALGIAGEPLWSATAGASLEWPPHWQRGASSVVAAREATEGLQDGDVVLAPPDLAITIDVMTTRIKTVAPRKYFMDYLRDEPGFHYEERGILMDFVDPPPGHHSDRQEVARALDTVGVAEVCLPADSRVRQAFVREQGFRRTVRTAGFTCLRR